MKNNITHIVKNNLCTQCGTCLAICHEEAISLFQHEGRGLLPRVDEDKCTECGLCLKVCPGEDVNFQKLQKDVFGSVSQNKFFGHVIRVLSGYSAIPEVRYNGASGGAVAGMLIDLLENNIIDGVLVVNMRGIRPLWPNVFIAHNREEVVSAQQSKYIPVPINIGLKEILENETKSYAVVGLPCHFHGLRMLENIKPQLKKQIVLRIGLFCGFNPTPTSTRFLLKRTGVKDIKSVVDIKYRDGDWPCGFRAVTKDGSDHFLYPIDHFLFSHYIFERYRCAMCTDHTNELADISIGDEWRENLRSDPSGWSYIVTRTKIGDEFVHEFIKRGTLIVEKSSLHAIYSGQGSTIIYKKHGTVVFGKIQHMLGHHIPRYLTRMKLYPRFEYFVGSFLNYFVPRLFEIKIIRILFLRVPVKFYNRYRILIIRLFEK